MSGDLSAASGRGSGHASAGQNTGVVSSDLLAGLAISLSFAVVVSWSLRRIGVPGWEVYGLLTFFFLPLGVIAGAIRLIQLWRTDLR